MKKYNFIILAIIIGLPQFAFAQTSVDGFLDYFLRIIKFISEIIGAAAIGGFFFNIIKLLQANSAGKPVELSKYKDMLVWSGIALFMMIGIWSIVAYIQGSLGDGALQSDIRKTPAMPEDIRY